MIFIFSHCLIATKVGICPSRLFILREIFESFPKLYFLSILSVSCIALNVSGLYESYCIDYFHDIVSIFLTYIYFFLRFVDFRGPLALPYFR